MLAWWRFLLAPPSPEPGQLPATVFELLGLQTFCAILLFGLILFTAILQLKGALAARFPPFGALDARTQGAGIAWVAAYVHHAIVALFAVVCLWRDFTGQPRVPLTLLAAAVPFSLAYCISDTVATVLPDVMDGKYEMLVHHLLGHSMCLAVLAAPPTLLRFATNVWVLEVRCVRRARPLPALPRAFSLPSHPTSPPFSDIQLRAWHFLGRHEVQVGGQCPAAGG